MREGSLSRDSFIAFGLIAPNVFATLGILVAHAYSLITHVHCRFRGGADLAEAG